MSWGAGIAWLLHGADDVVPIPGTRRRRYLEENSRACEVERTNRVVLSSKPSPADSRFNHESAMRHSMQKNFSDVQLVPAVQSDGPALADSRVLAMRESLERIDRFDPDRARERFLSSFDPADTRNTVVGAQRVGFVEEAGFDNYYLREARDPR